MTTLLPCQTEAVAAWIAKGGRGYLSAAVGSGKSFVAAAAFKASMDKYPAPALYLTTKSALREQIKKFEDFGLIVLESLGNMNAVHMTTIERMVIEWETVRRIPWGCIIIDEADRLTAGASKRNRRLLQLNPRHKLMMSGTILKNGLKDSFFPVMWLSKTAPWRNWTDFKNKELLFNNPMVPNMMTGIRDEQYLADLVKPLVIEMVNPDAPKELVAEIISCPMGEEQRRAYEKMKEDLILECKNGTLTISNRAVLNLRLRQFTTYPPALGHDAPSSKMWALAELLKKVSGPTIIFTSFATIARELAKFYDCPLIEGATSAKGRTRILASKPDLIIATSAAERGIDCPWVKNIISLDQGFTPAVMRQRAGRATRYGRTGEARLFLLQCPGTVDETSEAKIILRKLKEARKVCQPKVS